MSLSSASRPLIAVFGATGQQGGAVFRALLSSKQFRVRAVTRDPQTERAKNLLANDKSDDVDVVAANLNDSDSLLKAFTGAWGVFLVTSWRDIKAGEPNEEQQAKNAADQALKAGVKFFVYSSLPDASTISGGRHFVAHFSLKHKAEQYIRSLSFADGSAFPYPGCFATNFLTIAAPKKNVSDGVYEMHNIVRHDVAVPIVDIEEEYGLTVLEIFRHPKKYSGQSIFTGNYVTLPQFCDAFTKATGKACRYVQLPLEAGKNFGEDAFDMLQYWNNFGFYGGAAVTHIEHVKKLDPLAFWKSHAQQF